MTRPKPSEALPRRQLIYLPLAEIKADPRNPRAHTHEQVKAIARSIRAFGFNAPILIDKFQQVRAGHGRLKAAALLGLSEVPVICLENLSEAQARAYMLADNQLTDRSSWNDELLAVHLRELSELAIEFEIEDTGFEAPEIDIRIQSLDPGEGAKDDADVFDMEIGPAVSRAGDLWHLNGHRLFCGNALDRDCYAAILGGDKAAVVFTDPPYNVKINGHAGGKGSVQHREFAMASGEMSEAEFTAFLSKTLENLATWTAKGALIYVCMDWRHMDELRAAGRANGLDLINLCVWAKTNGGMGSLYRSRHELVFVFRSGAERHLNNVQLGRFGRNRTNVWNYPGANSFTKAGGKRASGLHPTVKPIALVADALLDSTKRDDVVLDPYLGSGTTVLAAERTGRRASAIEIDPLYVDTAIRRWERMTGERARLSDGRAFSEIVAERGGL